MAVKKTDKIEIALILGLILTLAFTFVLDAHIARHVLDDDAASELMLSSLLHQEQKLYSNNWHYSTEFTFLNQISYIFFFNFFDGWSNVRVFGTFLLQILYLFSFQYMMYESGLGRKEFLLGSILVMLPYCVAYGRVVLYHVYYICYFIPCFLIFGLFFSLLRRTSSTKISKSIRFFLLILLTFINCTLYVRFFIISIIPIFGALVFYLIKYSQGKKTPYRKWMLIPVIMFFSGMTGMLCSVLFLNPLLDLYQPGEQKLIFLSPSSWGPMLTAFFMQFGFRPQVKLFSLAGLLSLGGLFFSVFALTWMIPAKDLDFREFVFRTMFPINILINFLYFIFVDVPYMTLAEYSRYFLFASVWLIPIICYEMKNRMNYSIFRRLTGYFCLLIFISNSFFNAFSFLHNQSFGQIYDGVPFLNPHLADDLQSAVEFIQVHDYIYGYAFVGEVNTLVELMNGKIPIVSLRRNNLYLMYSNWLTQESWKTLPEHSGFFLISETDEPFYAESLERSGAEKVYFDDFGYVIYDISDLPAFRLEIKEPDY